ncbi:MAG: leucine-rich repeat domain-containing protein [Candidatus Algichlamydia australiensis]|nr:leucine-rich repeat domain-containing protein [Chlamydiales bacterium]
MGAGLYVWVSEANSQKEKSERLTAADKILKWRSGELDLSNLNLTEFPIAILDLKNVTSLNCSGNKLSQDSAFINSFFKAVDIESKEEESQKLNKKFRAKVALIKQLDLSDNRISDLNDNPIIKNITHLNLSNNTIEDLDFFQNLEKLEELNLSGNQELKENEIPNLKRLPKGCKIDLSNTPYEGWSELQEYKEKKLKAQSDTFTKDFPKWIDGKEGVRLLKDISSDGGNFKEWMEDLEKGRLPSFFFKNLDKCPLPPFTLEHCLYKWVEQNNGSLDELHRVAAVKRILERKGEEVDLSGLSLDELPYALLIVKGVSKLNLSDNAFGSEGGKVVKGLRGYNSSSEISPLLKQFMEPVEEVDFSNCGIKAFKLSDEYQRLKALDLSQNELEHFQCEASENALTALNLEGNTKISSSETSFLLSGPEFASCSLNVKGTSFDTEIEIARGSKFSLGWKDVSLHPNFYRLNTSKLIIDGASTLEKLEQVNQFSNLETIVFKNITIQKKDWERINSLKGLKKIEFEDCTLSDMTALELPKVEELTFAGESFADFPSGFFRKLPALEMLKLEDNYKLESFPLSVIELPKTALVKLKNTAFSKEKVIRDIDARIVQGPKRAPTIEVLDPISEVRCRTLKAFDEGTFRQSRGYATQKATIKKFERKRCGNDSFRKEYQKYEEKLSLLEIEKDDALYLDTGSYPNLKRITLTGPDAKCSDFGTLSMFPKLEELNLMNSGLGYIGYSVFSTLKKLSLNGGKLIEAPNNMSKNFKRLEVVEIFGNCTKDDLMEFVKKLPEGVEIHLINANLKKEDLRDKFNLGGDQKEGHKIIFVKKML